MAAVASDAAEGRTAAAAVLVAAERNARGATRRAAVRMMLAAESATEEGEDFGDFDDDADLRALCTASKRRFGEDEDEEEDGEDEDGDGEDEGGEDEGAGRSAGKKKKKAKFS